MNRLMAALAVGALIVAGAIFFILGRVTADDDSASSREATPSVSVSNPPASAPTVPALPDAEEARRIPPMFQGSWAPDRLSCNTRGETARVAILADRMRFYESAGQLVRATPLGAREYSLELSMTGEGQQWRRTIILRRVGHELGFRDADAPGERLYMRC